MPVTHRSIIAGSAVAVAFGAFTGVFGALYALPIGALAVPLMVVLWMRCGAFCGVMALCCMALGLSTQFHWSVALFAVISTGPAVVLCARRLSKKEPVRRAVLEGSAAALGGMMAFWLLYTLFTGSHPAADVIDYFERSAAQALATLPPSIAQGAGLEDTVTRLFAESREDLMGQVVPQMALLAALSGLLGATLPICFFRATKRGDKVSQLAPAHIWRVPRRLSLALIPAYLLTYLLFLGGVPGMLSLSSAVWQVVQVVYGVACLSAVAALLRRRGVQPGVGMSLLLALSLVLMLILHLLSFAAMAYVLWGFYSEMRRMPLGILPGEEHGPFGPSGWPKPRKEDDMGNGD